MDTATPPLDAFATYLLRRLAEERRAPPAILTTTPEGTIEGARDVPGETEIALVRLCDPRPAGGREAEIDQQDLEALARSTGLTTRFQGTGYAVLDRYDPLLVGLPPEGYRVLAIVTTFNEGDIVGQLVDRLLDDGIDVHVIDNWSTDGTFELVAERAGTGRCTMERFPAAGPTPYFELGALLRRVEEVAHESGADWVVHHDCDEIRQAPWPGVGLRQGLYALDRFGFNCVDHTVTNFLPVDDRFRQGDDLEAHFRWFEFGDVSAHFQEQKAWKPQAEPVEIASTGGHEAAFEGRRVFPYKFLLRHYPIRSQSHGERKIFRERQGRFHPGERARGWHIHYDSHLPGSSFLRDPAGLLAADDLDGRYLLQRLSGAGLTGNPNPGEGPGRRDAAPLRVVVGADAASPALSSTVLRILLSVSPLPPGTLRRALASTGRAVAAFAESAPGVAVELSILDHSSAPVLAAHQLEHLAGSLGGLGERVVTYEHLGPEAGDRASAERQPPEGAPDGLTVLSDGWCFLATGCLSALVGAAAEKVGVVFARQLPVEPELESDLATGERWPRHERGEPASCVLVRNAVLERLDARGRAEGPSAAELVAACHEVGLRVHCAPAATYVRDEPVAMVDLEPAR